MKVLVSGATGFIGHAVCRQLLLRGHDLVILSRNASRAKETFPFPCEIHEWDPMKGAPPSDACRGVEAVINLAGESVAAGRWTYDLKKRIHDSRVIGTRHLWQGFDRSKMPRVFVGASAIGIYGDRGDEFLREDSASGLGFLAQVCRDWEKESLSPKLAEAAPVRKAVLRIGMVLGREGGALSKLLPLFAAGLGGPVGSGKQWMSWIHVEDLAKAFVEAIENDAYQGPINAVAPAPVSNERFTRALAKAVHRPAWVPAPRLALRVALGEMSEVVLGSQRVDPSRLKALHFEYQYATLSSALEAICDVESTGGTEEVVQEQWIDRPVGEVFEFFSEAKNLERITPDWLGFQISAMSTPKIEAGTLIDYRLKLHGIPLAWRTKIDEWVPERRFVDSQLSGPYAHWRHTHVFIPMKGGTMVRDRVLYRLPLGFLGKGLAHWKVRKDIEEIFSFRKRRVKEILS